LKNGSFNLLYIDDNVSELKQVVRLLSRYPNIHLMTAHTPKIGLDLASEMHFDLIMLEINMPVMDGFTFLNELRKRSLFAEIPVIAMTANSAQYDAKRLNAAGFTNYLTKPIDRSHFFGILDNFWPLTDQNKEK
jgi:CheY-like chemotaxis protein